MNNMLVTSTVQSAVRIRVRLKDVIVFCVLGAVVAIGVEMRTSTNELMGLPSDDMQPAAGTSQHEANFASNEILIKSKTVAASNNATEMKDTISKILGQTRDGARVGDLPLNIKDIQPVFWGKEMPANSGEGLQAPIGQSTASESLARWEKVTLDTSTDVRKLIEQLARNPDVEEVEPNMIASVSLVPDDPFYSTTGSWQNEYDDLWGLKRINAEQAWDVATGEQSDVIAVIDTGIDYAHPDLEGKMWMNEGEVGTDDAGHDKRSNGIDDDGNTFIDDVYGYDFVNHDADPTDDHYHGTHVSGTIAAATNNAQGIAGINWNGRLMAVKGLDRQGSGSSSNLAQAIRYAVDNGANVINMSWGGYGTSSIIDDALAYANDHGVILVAAAGNSDANAANYFPASSPLVLTVAAWCPNNASSIAVCLSRPNGDRAQFSNYGEAVDVTAPGAMVLSLYPSQLPSIAGVIEGQYIALSGTSMAAPHVSGVASLLAGLAPEFSKELVDEIIRQSADDVVECTGKSLTMGGNATCSTGRDDYTGYGLLNAGAAAEMVRGLLSRPAGPELIAQAQASVSPDGKTLTFQATVMNAGQTSSTAIHYTLFFGNPEDSTVLDAGTMDALVVRGTGVVSKSIVIDVPPTSVTFVVDAQENEYFTVNNAVQSDVVYAQMLGWPKGPPWSTRVNGTPHLADLDADGDKEVIAIYDDVVLIWHHDGKAFAGWRDEEVWGVSSNRPWSSAVDDFDHDGKNDLAFWFSSRLYLVYQDGGRYPRWPVGTGDAMSCPTVADVDQDGDTEVLYYYFRANLKDGKLQIFKSADGDGDGSPDFLAGWPQSAPMSQQYSGIDGGCPVVSDLDGDGSNEVIFMNHEQLYVWSNSGRLLPGWPQALSNTTDHYGPRVTPAVGDINGDGRQDIVAISVPNYRTPPTVHAFGLDGKELDGWPVTLSGDLHSTPVLVDLDEDGILDVVVANDTSENNKYATSLVQAWRGFDQDDRPGLDPLNGWPRIVDSALYNSPAVSDLDGDGHSELIVGSNAGTLYVLEDDGTDLPGWPRTTSDTLAGFKGSPTVDDINKDGRLDIIFNGGYSEVMAWSVPWVTDGKHPWPQLYGTDEHTSRYALDEGVRLSWSSPAIDSVIGGTYPLTVNVIGEAFDTIDFTLDGNQTIGLVTCSLESSEVCKQYQVLWNTVSTPSGQHSLTAKAAMNGNIVTSVTTSVTVDRDPPFVTIQAPTPGQIVASTTTITTDVTDNNNVQEVRIVLDGNGVLKTLNSPPYTYEWDTRSVSDGDHTITVEAYDGAHNRTQEVRTVTVHNAAVPSDTAPPAVTINAPHLDETVTATLDVWVSAEDRSGVQFVEFFIDGVFQSRDQVAPYEWTLDSTTVSNGTHRLKIVSRDVLGNEGEAELNFVIKNVHVTLSSLGRRGLVRGTVQLRSTVTGASATKRVGFYLDGKILLSSQVLPPYTKKWNTRIYKDGVHRITTVASVGNKQYLSSPVRIIIDNTSPRMQITVPKKNIASGTFTVLVKASDLNGVAFVTLTEGGSVLATDKKSPYKLTWNTRTANNGIHRLTVRAFDIAGNDRIQSFKVVTRNKR